jgi:hypothetical protein
VTTGRHDFAPGNGSGEETDTEKAIRFSKLAMDHALNTHELVGQLAASTTKQIRELRDDVREGFRSLGVTVRKHERSLSDAEEEITLVRNLRASLNKATKRSKAWAISTISAIVIAVATAYAVASLGLHK